MNELTEKSGQFTPRTFDGSVTIDRRTLEFITRVIPVEKFVEYEPSDLEWMIPLGMAPEIIKPNDPLYSVARGCLLAAEAAK